MESKNARLGLQLFLVYSVLYGGFVVINAFAPEKMELTPIAGINLAILCGFGLIIAALLLALIYGVVCQGEDANVTPAAPLIDTAARTDSLPPEREEAP